MTPALQKIALRRQNSDNALSAEEVISEVRLVEAEMPFLERLDAKTPYWQLKKTAEHHANRPAVSFQLTSEPNGKFQTLSWSNLLKRTTQAANFFRELGVRDNDVVAYLLPTLNETVEVLMGAMTAGKVNPINPLLEAEQISSILRETNAKVLVTLKGFPKSDLAHKAAIALNHADCVEHLVEIDLLPHVSGIARHIIPFVRPKSDVKVRAKRHDYGKSVSKFPDERLDFMHQNEDRFGALFHTGGTTGNPKVAQHRFSGVLYNGWCNAQFLFNQNDVVLCPLPLFHVMAAYPIWMGCLFSGAHMVLPTPLGYRGEGVVRNFWKLVDRWKISVMTMVPTAASALLEFPVEDSDISSLRVVISGSSPLPPQLYKRFEDATEVRILEGYGMTEATCLVSSNPFDGTSKIGSVGVPTPYCDVKILICDKLGTIEHHCDINEVGEICISNPGVVLRETYTEDHKNQGLYASESGKLYLRTGDLGRLDEDGYLWITGRAKDLIIRGGHNIDPNIIEDALMSHPQVAFVGAIGQPDLRAGELPSAYVELVGGATVTSTEILAHAEKHVPERAAVPKYIEILDELPKTAVGKVFKPDLRKRAIRRVFDEALDSNAVNARVVRVDEIKGKGLVAYIDKGDTLVTDQKISEVLGGFPVNWAISKKPQTKE